MFLFAEGAIVALKNDKPGLDLKAGDQGVIWALYETQPPMYEITFHGCNGQDFDITLAENEILEVTGAKKSVMAYVS